MVWHCARRAHQSLPLCKRWNPAAEHTFGYGGRIRTIWESHTSACCGPAGAPAEAMGSRAGASACSERLVVERADVKNLTRMTPAFGLTKPLNTVPASESAPGAVLGDLPVEGRVIVNPISGERIVIRVSGDQTAGKLLVFDLYLPPGAHVPARHVHPSQEECFTVISGRMSFRIGSLGWRAIQVCPGETLRVPAGAAHWFGNRGTQLMHARVEVRPALRMQELFETTEAIGRERPRQGRRRLRLTDLARIALEFDHEVAVPNAPAFLVRALLAPVAWLGRRRRSRATSSGRVL